MNNLIKDDVQKNNIIPLETLNYIVQEFCLVKPYPKVIFGKVSKIGTEFNKAHGAYLPNSNTIIIDSEKQFENSGSSFQSSPRRAMAGKRV